jgi:hypothetical protein
VQDTTPPTITCQPDRSVLAGDVWNFDVPVASDACSSVVVQVLTTVTNIAGQSSLAIRTWAAVDACGNSNTCQQTITITNPLPPPLLQAELMPEGAVKLSWPSLPAGYQLEACDRFTSTNWNLISISPVSTNGMNTVEFMPTLQRNFYRLRKP